MYDPMDIWTATDLYKFQSAYGISQFKNFSYRITRSIEEILADFE